MLMEFEVVFDVNILILFFFDSFAEFAKKKINQINKKYISNE